MNQYVSRIIGRPYEINNSPFKISQSGEGFYVSSGRCYSTFSYSQESLVPISNLYKNFNIPFNEIGDYCAYIEFSLLPNLQVSGGSVKFTKVGNNLNFESSEDWVDYPNMYKIRPFDIKNPDGTIKQIIDNKQQQKCYLLLGRFWENYPETEPYNIQTVTGRGENDEPKFYYLSSYNESDIILMQSNVSGVPVIFPMPYLGGPYWKTKEEYPK